ncbi:MAG: hypothetical protein H6510_05225 [Acidobacteria bacterium]|nr:hypothetical protein [Acidobacteriota bacterium]MCB9397196.1 hypothetical protein [Acidobacteriota bacterium]
MPELLQCLRENGTIAAVFCRPLNHQTYQLKGKVQAIRPLADSDRAAIDAYLTSWVEELAELGFGEDYARAIQPPVSDPTWAVTFRIEAVFDQTPGPKAGTAIPQVGLNP